MLELFQIWNGIELWHNEQFAFLRVEYLMLCRSLLIFPVVQQLHTYQRMSGPGVSKLFCKETDGKYFSKYCRLSEPSDLSQVLDSAIGVRAATISNIYKQNGCCCVSVQFIQKLAVGQIWPAGCRPWSGFYFQPFFAYMSIVPFTVLFI